MGVCFDREYDLISSGMKCNPTISGILHTGDGKGRKASERRDANKGGNLRGMAPDAERPEVRKLDRGPVWTALKKDPLEG